MSVTEAKVDVKTLSDNTANIGLANIGDVVFNADGRGLANTITAMAIARHPEKLTELRAANADGIVASYQRYRESMSWMTDQQAFLFAMGTPVTSDQAANIFGVLGEAGRLLEERGVEPDSSSAPKVDKMLEGAKNCEEWAREKWAKLIAGELEQPGTFSRRAMSALDQMSKHDAELFEKLCSMCVGGWSDALGRALLPPNPLIVPDGNADEYNGGALTFGDLVELEDAGVLNTGMRRKITVRKSLMINIGDDPYLLSCDNETDFVFEEAVLSTVGVQLSRLCKVGTFDGLVELFGSVARKRGFTVAKMKAGDGPGRYVQA